MSQETIFEMVKASTDLPKMSHDTFIKPMILLELTGNSAKVYLENEWARGFVRDTYGGKISTAWREVLGVEIVTEFFCETDVPPELCGKFRETAPIPSLPENGTEEDNVSLPELQDDEEMVGKLASAETRGRYEYTFDTFIISDSNRLAFTACRGIVSGKFAVDNPLFIYSEPGLGKTHLLTAVKTETQRYHSGMNVVFTNSANFFQEYVTSIQSRDNAAVERFKNRYNKADMLLIDDVQFFAGKKESQQALFDIFNVLHQNRKQIILTSDRPPKEINDLEDRLKSRFEWGLMADIGQPELETRMRIVERKAELIGLAVPDKVIRYIAENIRANIRQLEGVIIKMNALCTMKGSEPTLVMAQNVLRDFLSEQQQAPEELLDKIIREVADHYGVTAEDIRGKAQNAKTSTPRQIAIYIAFKVTGSSYTAIGREFGGRDHSTIVYAINVVNKKIAENGKLRNKIDDIIKSIGIK